MPKFKCVNNQCENYNKIEHITDVKYKFNPDSEKLEANVNCIGCGEKMEEVTENKSLSSINFSYDQQIKSNRVHKGSIY